MKRAVLFLTLLLVVGLGTAQAEWYGLNTTENAPPVVAVEAASAEGLTFDVDLSGFEYTEPREGFVSLTLPEETFAGQVGEPALPVINRLVRVPFGAEVRVTVDADWEEMPVAIINGAPLLMPVQEPLPKIPGAEENAVFTINPDAYASDTPFFSTAAAVLEGGVMRGYRLALIQIRPVNYVPAEELLRVASWMRVKVEFVHPDLEETVAREERYADLATAALASQLLVNGDSFGTKAEFYVPGTYLIIGGAGLFNSAVFDEFVQWQTQRGFTVVTATVQEIGQTATAIRNYIIDAYKNWDLPPSYVLLVGDTNIVPSIDGPTGCATDLYYAAVDGADYFPDLSIGRLSARTIEHLNNMLNKLLSYEKNEWTGGNNWTQHATFMASTDNWNVSEGTHNAVCANFLEPAGFTCTKVYSAHGGTVQQAIAALNTGPTIHAYSGHGSETSWADGPPMNQTQVRNLTNTTYPLVLSHACLTGSYNLPECFAETWQRSPTGALAFWGASASTYWDQDDIIERAMFRGWFKGNGTVPALPWVKAMLDFSLMKLYEVQPTGGYTKHYFEMYNLFGEPEVQLYSAPPATVNAQYASQITPETSQLSVDTGVAHAMIGLTRGGELLGTAFADASGQAVLAIEGSLANGDSLTLTITGQNLAPFNGTVTVSTASDDDADDDATDDDATGDDDAAGDDDATDDDAADDDDDDDDSGGCA